MELVCVVVMAVDVKDVKNVGDVVNVVVADSDVDISADVDSTLAGVVAASVDDNDVNISDDVGDSIRVVVAVVGVDVSANVESISVDSEVDCAELAVDNGEVGVDDRHPRFSVYCVKPEALNVLAV